ncbi:antibiotic biosynthesis monooxygenase family protein [Bacillus solimangrovi]|uniref:ABM domain-containing protein n=1 Tax=Bacillus solimangrovi TaxID=1305675 RepID=A0A1E5LGU7_9BACI|nr:antibiotic biosynthesis monooxygenase family protein [Bacillus solimangrovi]OEH93276.1 hypothetical protein BFG57_12825 [Bacillus solimangrovi]
MITELACFDIKEDTNKQFEETFQKAEKLIMTAEGYISHSIHRSIEKKSRYYIFVQWDSVGSHMEKFQKSADFQTFVELIGSYIEDSFMEHLEEMKHQI